MTNTRTTLPHQGRTALVTGAGRGLGRASAMQLASEGASVILVGRRTDALTAVADEIDAAGGRSIAIAADVSSDCDVPRLAAEAGPVDI